MQIEEILIIKNGSESYGISTEDISQISRVPSLMQLPLRPSGVRGLCAVSGSIITMVDMNLLLDMNEVDYNNDKSRLVLLNDKLSSSALLVSEIYNTVEVEEKNIEYIEKENDPVIAIYKYKDSLVQVISLEILFSKISKISVATEEVKSGKPILKVDKEEEKCRFLVFSMAKEKYSLNIDYLREIILADTEYTEIAGSPDEVLGLITIREELMLVVDLRKHYGITGKNSDKNRILIASTEGKNIGLLVDEIIDINNYAKKDIEYMDDSFKENKIAGVIHDEDGLISFFDLHVINQLFKTYESFVDDKNEINDSLSLVEDSVMEVIVFKLADKEYSFEVDKVAEIIDAVTSTNVAFTNDGIDGIINIRGQIVTIVSLFDKLNIETKINEDSKIIVCEIDKVKIGFIVDSISDILNIKADEVREQEDELFSKILHLENGNRLVLSMDIDEIVSNEGR